MDFRYKAKVDKKWLKGRSLTDHKEDATEFETESEPTQIINQLKRDGRIAQKAVIKIVKKRESVELNYKNIYRESENKVIKTPYGKMQIVDEFVIQDDDKLAFVQKAEEKYKELEKDGWFSFEKTEPYWYAFPYNRAKFTLCANDTDKICFIDYRKEGYDDTLKKNYGEVTINNLHEYKKLGVNMDFRKIYREANSLRKISEAANNSVEAFKAVFQKYFNEDFDRYVRWGEEFDCDEASLLTLICPEGLEDLIVFLPEIVKKEFPWYDAQHQRIEFNSVSAEEFDKLLGALCYVAQKLEDESAKSKAAWSTDLWNACNKEAIPQYSEVGERIYDAVSELSILSPEEKRALYNDWHNRRYGNTSTNKPNKPSENSVTKEEVFKKVYESDDMIEVDVSDYDNYEALNEVTCYLQDAAWSEFSGYEREDFEDEFPGWFTAHCDFTEYADYESLSDNYGLEEYKGVDPLNRF